jgi:hypothetical protein
MGVALTTPLFLFAFSETTILCARALLLLARLLWGLPYQNPIKKEQLTKMYGQKEQLTDENSCSVRFFIIFNNFHCPVV